MINTKNIDPGLLRHKITISSVVQVEDESGFQTESLTPVLTAYAYIKTTRGFTLIKNNTKFEEAYTNFTIRFTGAVISRGMIIEYNNKKYVIQYINDIDEENILLELQAKEVTH